MDGARDLDRERRHDPRAELHVDLVYDSFSSFLSVAAGNLSRGGMFLAVPHPAPVGTRLSFEARLRDGASLIRGEGEVVWARTEVTAGLPTGMAIRFTRLSAQAREVIARLLEQYPDPRSGTVRLGGVRLGKARGPADTAPPPVERTLPLGEALEIESPPARQIRLAPRPTATSQAHAPRPAADEASHPGRHAPGHTPDIRVTDEVGSEFDFTLPPWEAEEIPVELRPPNPVRNILVALAVLCMALVVISMGPANLIEMAGRVGSAIARRVLPQLSASPTPTTAQLPDATRVEPVHSVVPSPIAAAQAGDTTERAGQAADETSLTIERVAWRRGAGGVVVTVEADRDIPLEAVHTAWLSEPLRHVIRIQGVGAYRGRSTLDVRRNDLARIRVGLHRDQTPAELYIVLDFGSSPVTVEPLAVHGRRIELAVRSGGA